MRKSILFFILTTALCILSDMKSNVFAQDNSLMYFSRHPYANSYNPAFISNHRFYLYAVGRISLGVQTSGFSWDNLINKVPGSNNSMRIDADGFLNRLKENNNLSPSIGFDVAGLGFKVARNYFSLGVSVNFESKIKLPFQFVDFMFKGTDNLNSGFIFNDELINAVAYSSVYLGYAREITDRLTVGVKFKMYNGLLNIRTNRASTSSGRGYADALYGDIDMDMSFFFGKFQTKGIGTEESGDFKFEKEDDITDGLKRVKDNKGYGIDLGAVFRLNDNMEISAAVIDLGKITWKNNAVKMFSKNRNREVEFTAISTDYDEIKEDVGQYFSDIGDSLKAAFGLDVKDLDKYTTEMPAKVYIGYSWQIVPHIYLQALYNARFISSDFESSLSVNAALMTGFFSVSVGNTIKYTPFNPNILLSFGNAFIGSSFSSYRPKHASGFSVYIGWSIGMKNRKKHLSLKTEDSEGQMGNDTFSFLEIKTESSL